MAERLFVMLEGAYVTAALEGDGGSLDRSRAFFPNWWRQHSGIVREAGEHPGAGEVTLQLFGKRRYVVLAFTLLVLFWGRLFGRKGRFGALAAHDLCRSENPDRWPCNFARGCYLG